MSLPLPEPSMEWPSLCVYNASELEDYGQACRDAALEEAAMAAEYGFKYDLNGYQIADNIRSLK